MASAGATRTALRTDWSAPPTEAATEDSTAMTIVLAVGLKVSAGKRK